MSSPDRGAGPQISQDVLNNDGGTITAATIYGLNADGTVKLAFLRNATPPSINNASVGYDPNLGIGKWSYPAFQ